jgi:hypothetical protein
MKKETFAIIDRVFDDKWVPIFRWADSESRKFQGHFLTIDDAINAIPQNIKKIIINYNDDRKIIDKEINRESTQ